MIHALPGMGADKGVFPGPWRDLVGIRFIQWSGYASATSIAELARRIAEAEPIRDGDILIGTSMGGILATEIAKLRRISRLVLVAGVVSKNEVGGLLGMVRSLAPLAPIESLQALSARFPG